MTPVRDRVHRLVDQLPEAALPEVETLLAEHRTKADTVFRAPADPQVDDEPLADNEAAAIQEGLDDIAAGRVVSHAEACRRLSGHQ